MWSQQRELVSHVRSYIFSSEENEGCRSPEDALGIDACSRCRGAEISKANTRLGFVCFWSKPVDKMFSRSKACFFQENV